MRFFVGVTDNIWYNYLKSLSPLEEVNFWQPSGKTIFKAISPGELFLFKLHHPLNYIVGGGIFAYSTILPISLVWESFQQSNGSKSYLEFRNNVAKYWKIKDDGMTDYRVGCIILEQPFFLPESLWIEIPPDWQPNIVKGKTYDASSGYGPSLWKQLHVALLTTSAITEKTERYAQPVITHPRLGQGSFRVLVTDAYDRKCAITDEKTLPALDAAHIKPYSDEGLHSVNNGILLRKDIHALFDRGYITVDSAMTIEVSRKIREEYENGRDYYRLHGSKMRLPSNVRLHPSKEFLEWHNNHIFRG